MGLKLHFIYLLLRYLVLKHQITYSLTEVTGVKASNYLLTDSGNDNETPVAASGYIAKL